MYISLKELLKINKELNKEILIGKKGISEKFEKELIKLLIIKKAIKIRVLKNCPIPFEEVIKKIASLSEKHKINFIITQIRGRTFVIVLENVLKK